MNSFLNRTSFVCLCVSADTYGTFGNVVCWLQENDDMYAQYHLPQYNASTCPQAPTSRIESSTTCRSQLCGLSPLSVLQKSMQLPDGTAKHDCKACSCN